MEKRICRNYVKYVELYKDTIIVYEGMEMNNNSELSVHIRKVNKIVITILLALIAFLFFVKFVIQASIPISEFLILSIGAVVVAILIYLKRFKKIVMWISSLTITAFTLISFPHNPAVRISTL